MIIWPWQRLRLRLEAEIEWLKEQLAQRQRRIDELQESLISIANKPSMKVQYTQKPDGKLVPVQPRGWDALRAARRAEPPEEEQPIEGPFKTEDNDAIPS